MQPLDHVDQLLKHRQRDRRADEHDILDALGARSERRHHADRLADQVDRAARQVVWRRPLSKPRKIGNRRVER